MPIGKPLLLVIGFILFSLHPFEQYGSKKKRANNTNVVNLIFFKWFLIINL